MALQIPYNPTQTVEPQIDGSGAHYQDVPQANPAAFGAQIGVAEENASDQINKLSDKFANIYNQSTARDAVNKTATQMADAEARFHQLQGNDAVKGLKPFQDEIKQIAQNNSDGLSLVGNQMYQSDAASLVNNATFRAGAHVGEQAEVAQKNSLTANIATNVNQFAANATNPTGASYLQGIQDSALGLAHHMGVTNPAVADQMVSHNYGEAYSAAIRTNLQSNPDAAKSLWDQAQGGFTKPDGTTVPYLDANHRAQIASEMGGAFRQQFSEQMYTARMYAASGVPYNKDALIAAAKNAGYNQDYINAETMRLDQLAGRANVTNTRYTVEKALDNSKVQAENGQALTDIPSDDTIKAAYPNEPQKAQDTINEFHDQYKVAGFVGTLPTTPISQIGTKLNDFAPKNTPATQPQVATPETTNAAIGWTMQHEGGFVANDSGKGPSKFGINQEANPGVDVANLTQDQAAKIMHDKYWVGVGADKMSPQMGAVAFDTAVNMGVGKANQLVAESGNDPQKLIDLRRASYQQLATSNPDKYGKDLAGWNARLDDLQKTLGAPQATGSDFADQARLYTKVQAATTNYLKQLSDDPAGTITSHDQNLTNMLNDGMQDPTKMGTYIDAMNARQKLLEVPQSQQSVLPQATATALSNSITASPNTAAQTMNDLQTKTGKYWPQVYQSLVTQGGLPPFYQSVAQLGSDPSTSRDATLLTQWMANTPKDKTAGDLIGSREEKTIKDTIQSDASVASLTQSLLHSGASPTQVDGVVSSIETLAYAKKLFDQDPNAAEDAVASFTKNYQFMPQGGARIPTKNYDAVTQVAQSTLANVDQHAVVPPAFTTGESGNVKPDDYWRTVKSNPTWVTSPDETSIWLKDPWDRLVRGKDGNPISVPFNVTPPPQVQSKGLFNSGGGLGVPF